ncbi:MAG: flagellar hook-basal body complex protein [Oscillospiraceae bacterium]|nr:flagellar hook-basal body complex protein [Oscillospiraceae bacterium]
MYAAISGLKAHMNKLNVIGNNIANVNTYGYKTQRAMFSDSIYATLTAGSDGTETAGAINPSQIGYGVEMSSVDLDMSSGTFSPTGKDTDCMIMGDGFFLVGDKGVYINPNDPRTLTSLSLTRVGNFEFKADGYLSDANGNAVYGFMAVGNSGKETIFSEDLVAIQMPRLLTEYLDGDGNPVETPQEGETYEVVPRVVLPGDPDYDDSLPYAGMDSISIDPATGLVSGTSKDTGMIVTIGILALGNVTNPNGVTHESGPYYKASDGAGDLQIAVMGDAQNSMRMLNGDATFETWADFNLADMTHAFTHINGSTDDSMRIFSAGTTELMTGGLEMSKTDLATEISEMITTQRGYQANTRIITVTDSMLEELVNIKR